MFILGIKKKWIVFAAVLLVLVLLFFQIHFVLGDSKEAPLICQSFPDKEKSFFERIINAVWGAALNPGSIFTVCALSASQPEYTTEINPSVTVYWTFGSSVGNTQKSYRVQISESSDFSSSMAVDTGTVSDVSARSYTSNLELYFERNYYWRLIIVDNNNSVTDWIVGDSFRTGRASSEVLTQQAKQQEINLQTTISSRSYE